MNFALTEDQEAIRQAIRELAAREFAPRAAYYDKSGEFPWENVRTLAQQGYLGMQIPPEYGGAGADYLSYAIVLEEVARACATTAVILDVQNSLHAEAIWRAGNEEQRRTFLPPLCRGEVLGAYCLTEPEAGSDAASIRTRAHRVANGYRLQGRKAFVTNGGVADRYLVYAVTDPDRGPRGISAFVVDKTMPGVGFGKPLEKLGIRASATCEVVLDDVFVPVERRLGEEGEGYRIALQTLQGGRVGIASQALGILQAAIDTAAAYALVRRQFGRPIAEFEAIQWMLAEMQTDVEAARLLVYRAAWLHDQGRRAEAEVAQAKLFASTVAVQGCIKAVQILGGYGYTSDYPVERYLRDVKITEIYEGTSEVQKLVIARALLQNYAGKA